MAERNSAHDRGLGHGRVLRDAEVIGAVVAFLEEGRPDAEAGTAREVTT